MTYFELGPQDEVVIKTPKGEVIIKNCGRNEHAPAESPAIRIGINAPRSIQIDRSEFTKRK